MMAGISMLIEREELAGPGYDPTHPDLQKWAHEEGSAYILFGYMRATANYWP